MWRSVGEAFLVGLTLGPACFLHCGLLHGAVLTRWGDGSRRRQLGLVGGLMGGRLAGYVAVGVAAGWLAGVEAVRIPQNHLRLALGLLMLIYAVLPSGTGHGKACACGVSHVLSGAFAVGFLSGLAPCPPFIGCVSLALQSGGMAGAVLVMVCFFIGSSVYLIPVWGVPLLVRQRWRPYLPRVGRLLAAGVAAYVLLPLVIGVRGGDVPAGPQGGAPGTVCAACPLDCSLRTGGVAGLGAGAGTAPTAAEEAAASPAATPASSLLPPSAGPGVRPLYAKKIPTEVFTEEKLTRLGLSLKEASFYEVLEDGEVGCRLCPRHCRLGPGRMGLCQARVNLDGKLRTIVYGRPVTAHVDPIEKKPLFHYLPGSRTMSFATAGCNSGCVFCQNYEISQASPTDVPSQEVPPERWIELSRQNGCAGIAYTYTEPTVFFEYMLDTAKLARAAGLRNYWITCGQIEEAPLRELCKVLDAANIDLKGFSDEFYVKYCNMRLAPVLRTLEICHREGVMVEVTNLVIPGANDDPEMIRRMCAWLRETLGPDVPLHFSRFHPAYRLTKTPPTPAATLEMARRIAREEGLRHVYIGNLLLPCGEDTQCPSCKAVLIRRDGFAIAENRLRDGKCPDCGAAIPGVWR
ncbi:MAG: Radical SAM superfamily protein [Lentisphaerae bacterium ADurb.BinA184]|nr:MAG: Radical SAM superfamily protein [Lentisphaerae bacterium ADurb.BinA184]